MLSVHNYEGECNSSHIDCGSLIQVLRSNCANCLQFLVDLKLEAILSSRPPQSSSLAGTKVFVATGALLGSHDGSFLRVTQKTTVTWDEDLRRSKRALTPPRYAITSKEAVDLKDC